MKGLDLFPEPAAELVTGLDSLEQALARVQPLRSKHRAVLPSGIRRLSEWLTADRDGLPPDYMTRAESLGAYMYYFLPWNIYRQGRLLQGLDLDLPPGARIVDLGAGPLTFLLALWMGCPGQRENNLEYTGIDRAAPALKAGAALFKACAPGSGWRVRIESRAAGSGRRPAADLLVMANFLNEIELPRDRGRSSDAEDHYGPLLERWSGMCATGGRVLLIEPGTRPAGRRLAALRQSALAGGWGVVSPCPHRNDCPQPGRSQGPWCHFTFSSAGAPAWLEKLSRQARLPKERASLSFLLLEPPGTAADVASTAPGEGAIRVVSESFPLPEGGSGRYGCSARGLVLLTTRERPGRQDPPPGVLVRVAWPDRLDRDGKSGALILPRSAGGGRKTGRGRT